MKISIVVITHGKLASLQAVLRMLEHADFPRQDFEVVVVDDGSRDGTAEMLDGYAPGYELRVIHREQGGRAAARNTGCRAARGRLLVMLDDDCLMRPDSLRHLWDRHEARPDSFLLTPISHVAFGHVPAVIGRVLADGPVAFSGIEALAPDDSDYAMEELFRRMLASGLDRFAVAWSAAQGSSASYAAEIFHRVGGYDEGFRTYGMEDFEFAYRAAHAGCRFAAATGAHYWHLDHGHQRRALLRESTGSVRHFYEKHGKAEEVGLFVKFLCGALSFRDFNNRVAARQGRAPIEDLDLRFSPYGMVSYRDRQQAPPAPPAYTPGQTAKLGYLLKKIAADLAPGAGPRLGDAEPLIAADLTGRRVLIVAPHMDDEVIGCGGLAMRFREHGSRVAVAFLTGGAPERWYGPEEHRRICRERRRESAVAGEILDLAEIHYLDLPDGRLRDHTAGPEPLAGVLRDERPDVLLVPAEREYHPDHRAAWSWVERAVAHLGIAPRIYAYEVCGNCRPDRYLLLDEALWDRKVRALLAYRTQMEQMDYHRLMSFVAEHRGEWLRPGSAARAEVFRQVAPGERTA